MATCVRLGFPCQVIPRGDKPTCDLELSLKGRTVTAEICHIGVADETKQEIKQLNQFSASRYRNQVVTLFKKVLTSKLRQISGQGESVLFLDVRPACGYFSRHYVPRRDLLRSLLHALSEAARHFQVRHRTRGLVAVIIWSENYVDDDSIPRLRQIICTSEKETAAVRGLLDALPNATC